MVMKKWSLILLLGFIACNGNSKENKESQTAPAQMANHGGKLEWQAPQGWIAEPPSSGMRKAQYRLPHVEGDPEDATVVVFYFQGQGGGVEANIDRWYSQFIQPDGKPSKDVAKVSTQSVNGLKQTIVDLSGTYLFQMTPMSSPQTEKPNFRMLAAIVESSEGPYFVKMVGPEKTVQHWESSFYDFMKTFRQ